MTVRSWLFGLGMCPFPLDASRQLVDRRAVLAAQRHRPITSKPPNSGSRESGISFALEFGGRAYPLGIGTFLIGRGHNVDFRLDGSLVSRQHAALDVRQDRVVIRDLASRNGVLVNGTPMRGSAPLHVGDTITVGSEDLRLVTHKDTASGRRSLVRTSSTRSDLAVPLASYDDDDEGQSRTHQADPLELLSSIVDRALEQGNAEEAETLISGHLAILLNATRLQRQLKPETCETATDYALKLARSTGKSRWVDYVFELHTTAGRPMTMRVVHELQSLLPTVRLSRRQLLDDYSRMLESLSARDAGPERAFVLERLERLIK
jgi:pSer/pThr/pTyr-binding forkhead associated (FHA) protein